MLTDAIGYRNVNEFFRNPKSEGSRNDKKELWFTCRAARRRLARLQPGLRGLLDPGEELAVQEEVPPVVLGLAALP